MCKRLATEFCSSLKSSSSSYWYKHISKEYVCFVIGYWRKRCSMDNEERDNEHNHAIKKYQVSQRIRSLKPSAIWDNFLTSSVEIPSKSFISPFINANNTSTCHMNFLSEQVKAIYATKIEQDYTLSEVETQVLFFMMLRIITIAMTFFVPASRWSITRG